MKSPYLADIYYVYFHGHIWVYACNDDYGLKMFRERRVLRRSAQAKHRKMAGRDSQSGVRRESKAQHIGRPCMYIIIRVGVPCYVSATFLSTF